MQEDFLYEEEDDDENEDECDDDFPAPRGVPVDTHPPSVEAAIRLSLFHVFSNLVSSKKWNIS